MSEEQIRERLRSLAEAQPVADDDPTRLVERRIERRKRRRVSVVAGLCAIVLVVAGVGAFIVLDDDPDTTVVTPPPTSNEAPSTTTTAPPTTNPRENVAGVTVLDPGPLEPRGDSAIVWTGEEVVVWGGDVEGGLNYRTFNDGAAYNPATREWRVLADAPIEGAPDHPLAFWTGNEVLVVSGISVATWNPDTNSWRRFPDLDVPLAPELYPFGGRETNILTAAWTGDELIVEDAWAALDPETGTWRDLADPPRRLDRKTTTWTGTELIVAGSSNDPPITFPEYVEAMAYDPVSDTWRELPGAPVYPNATAATWTGEELVMVGYGTEAAAYDPETNAWRELPSVPTPSSEFSPKIVTTSVGVVAYFAEDVAILGNGAWVALPRPDAYLGSLAIDGNLVYDYGRGELGNAEFTVTNVDERLNARTR